MSEWHEQAEVVAWFRERWPEHEKSLRCSMAGLARRGKQGAIQWAQMKAQGVTKGEPDFALMLPKGGFGGFLAEHKAAGSSHTLTDEQKAHLEYHNSIGNCAVSTRGVDALKAAIVAYMEE